MKRLTHWYAVWRWLFSCFFTILWSFSSILHFRFYYISQFFILNFILQCFENSNTWNSIELERMEQKEKNLFYGNSEESRPSFLRRSLAWDSAFDSSGTCERRNFFRWKLNNLYFVFEMLIGEFFLWFILMIMSCNNIKYLIIL